MPESPSQVPVNERPSPRRSTDCALNISGHGATEPRPGANDVSELSPSVYFVGAQDPWVAAAALSDSARVRGFECSESDRDKTR